MVCWDRLHRDHGASDMDRGKINRRLTELQDALRTRRIETGETGWYLTGDPAIALPSDKLRACRVSGSRSQFYQRLDSPKKVVETGTRDGDAALQIMRELDPLNLVCIDANFRALDLHRMAPFIDRIRLRPGKPWVQLETFSDDSFDLLVLAGVTDPQYVMRCLDAGLRVVKRGGSILCAGFTNWSPGSMQPNGVYGAVCEFLDRSDVELSHIILQPRAFHDAVLRIVSK